MITLERIEWLRKKLVKEIIELTGLPVDDFEVTVNFHNQDLDSSLVSEARQLDWYSDNHKGSNWYTSEKPTGGSTIVFLQEDKE